jgi:hypothetical protein
MRRPRHFVYFDPDAACELAGVKSKPELKAIDSVVEKLRDLGENLRPPHMKPLRGLSLRELRPRRGDSPWRPLYRRFGLSYVLLAIAHKDTFEASAARACERSADYPDIDKR